MNYSFLQFPSVVSFFEEGSDRAPHFQMNHNFPEGEQVSLVSDLSPAKGSAVFVNVGKRWPASSSYLQRVTCRAPFLHPRVVAGRECQVFAADANGGS